MTPHTAAPGQYRAALHLQLGHQAIYRLDDAAGMEIVCRSGSVWLTLDDDPRDIVLGACDSFSTRDHRRALLYAIEPSKLSVSMPAA